MYEIDKSLASSIIISFNCYYDLSNIDKLAEKYYLLSFWDASNTVYVIVVYIKIVIKYGSISFTFATSKLRVIFFNKSFSITPLKFLKNFISSNLIHSVYN